MSRDAITSQPTLQQITEQLQQLTDNLQWLADARLKCVCGYATHTLSELNIHRERCQILRMAVIGDIIRVANRLGRTPTNQEYNAYRSLELPAWSLLSIVVFSTWNDALTECRLPLIRAKKQPRKETVANPALKVFRRIESEE